MYGYTEERCIGYTPMSIYCFLVLDGRILQDSIVPKQALINAVYEYVCKSFFSVWALSYEVAGWQLPPPLSPTETFALQSYYNFCTFANFN